MDATGIIIAVSGLLAGLIAAMISWNNSRHIIKKDELSEIRKELSRLQDRIECLELENEEWRIRYSELYEYVMLLRGMMISKSMDVPPMPKVADRKKKPKKKAEEE